MRRLDVQCLCLCLCLCFVAVVSSGPSRHARFGRRQDEHHSVSQPNNRQDSNSERSGIIFPDVNSPYAGDEPDHLTAIDLGYDLTDFETGEPLTSGRAVGRYDVNHPRDGVRGNTGRYGRRRGHYHGRRPATHQTRVKRQVYDEEDTLTISKTPESDTSDSQSSESTEHSNTGGDDVIDVTDVRRGDVAITDALTGETDTTSRRQGRHGRRRGNGRRRGHRRGRGHAGWTPRRQGRRGHRFGINVNHDGMTFGISTTGLTDLIGSLAGIDSSSKWWTGPNVCETSEVDENKKNTTRDFFSLIHMQQCEDLTTSYVCTTTMECTGWRNVTVTTYRCCRGYSRSSGENGCPQQLPINDMTSTVNQLGVGEFMQALNDSSLDFTLTEENITMFAPTSEALANYQPTSVDLSNYVVLSSEEQDEIINEGRRLLEGHLVQGRVLDTSDFYNDQTIVTLHPASKIRINKYPNKVTTANCAKLISADNFATTGVVHVIDDVIVQERGTIYDFIKRNRKLSMMFEALSNTSLARTLRDTNKVFTVFALSNQAFEKLRPSVRVHLLGAKDGSCLNRALSAHILPKIWCSAGLTNGSTADNILNQNLEFTRDAENNLFVNGIRVITDDYVTENGVVHVIGDMLSTSAVAIDLAEEQGASHMVSLLNAASLAGYADDLENVTIFIPTNEALEAISPSVLDALKINKDKLRELLKFHIVNGTFTAAELQNGLKLPTLSASGQKLTVTQTIARARHFHQRNTDSMVNVQCAQIVNKDLWTCSGKTVVQFIDKVLLPPAGSIVDIMKQDEVQFSAFLNMVRRAGMTALLNSHNTTGLTLFLPTNEALAAMSNRLRTHLNSNLENLQRFIKGHIVNATICCSAARSSYWGSSVGLRTLTGNVVSWKREQIDHSVRIGPSPVRTCDVAATNGVVHVVDGFLFQRQQNNPLRIDWDLFDSDLFGQIDWFDD